MKGNKRQPKVFRVGRLAYNSAKPAPHVCPFHKHHRHSENAQSESPQLKKSSVKQLPKIFDSRRRTQQPYTQPVYHHYHHNDHTNSAYDLVTRDFKGILTDSEKTDLYKQLFWGVEDGFDNDSLVRRRAFDRLAQIYQEEIGEADRIVKQGIRDRIQKRKAILAKIQREKQQLLEVLAGQSDHQSQQQATEYIKFPKLTPHPISHS